MLLVGDKNCIPENYKVYNVTSVLEGFERIYITPPLELYQRYGEDEKTFDIKYAEYILSTDKVFNEFMKIIYSLYYGFGVYLLVDRNDYFDILIESVLKFIQQRYGYNAYILNSPEDINYIEQDDGFNIFGLYNFDIDNKRCLESDSNVPISIYGGNLNEQ